MHHTTDGVMRDPTTGDAPGIRFFEHRQARRAHHRDRDAGALAAASGAGDTRGDR
jgi:hypothetical protein